ncbi:MAG TPA: iron ABC transporter permease [Ilumatobacteraceae bacterium]|nr:iron ABC transporter permease [Ilumatobacteraceae bacterium]
MNRLPRWLLVALAIGPTLGLAVFYAWPFVTLVVEAVTTTAVTDTFGRASTWEVVWFTAWQAVVSTVVTIVVGLAPAYVVARFDFRGRTVLIGLLTAMFVLPTVVMGAAFLALLPDALDRTVWAVIGAHVVFNLAVVVRVVGSLWEHLPTDMEAAAATLGASRWRVATQISLPLVRPALTAAATIVFLFTFTSYGVIRILGAPGTRTIEVEVWRRATQLGDIGGAAVLALFQLMALVAIVSWSTVAQRRHARALGLMPTSTRRRPRTGGEQRFVALVAGLTLLVAATPLVALVVRSLSTPTGWSSNAWTDLGRTEIRPGIRIGIDPGDAIVNSLTNAAWATSFAVVIGALASLAIVAAGRIGRALDGGLMLPLATSAVTIGFGMLITFDTDPVDWRASWWLVPVGHALIAVPFVVRTCVGVLRSVDPSMGDAAATLGASPVRAWRAIVVPYLWRPLAVGAALATAISLGEFGATSFLSRSGGETMPIAIEQLLGRTGSALQAQGFVLATLLAATTVVLVVIVERLQSSPADREQR